MSEKADVLLPYANPFLRPPLDNVAFRPVFDIEDPWDGLADNWDVIHARALNGCIMDWPKLYRQVFK